MDDVLCDTERQLDQSALYWVGIGASAGGLEALRELGRHLPESIKATYIVTQHMAPKHKSMMSELVGRETSLPVMDITDGLEPAANHIYITPPNQDLSVEGNKLRLHEPSKEPGAPKPSVNRFFRALATELGDRAIGVILSGTGSDGAYGIQAIRAAGGITIAQDEGSAKYDGMPNAAIETGCVDLVMSPADIGGKLERIIQAPRDLDMLKQSWTSGDDLSDLMHLLLARTRVDFRDYKPATVRRRIDRRMTALSILNLSDYVNHVRDHADEVDELFRDLLISVTSFFRDAGEFETMKRHLGEAVKAQPNDEKYLRIWVAGCASGEEAYSIAILAAEAMGGFPNIGKTGLQIFATDIDETAIDQARKGLYPEAALQDLPSAYRERYFHRVKDNYQVAKRLRETVMFSYHDVTRDPPFRNINLVSCRNLLIYFRQSLQERVLARFHYALCPGGLLFLGKSESVSGSSSLFRMLGDDRRVFQKRSSIASPSLGSLEYQPPFRARKTAISSINEDHDGPRMAAMFDSLVRAVGPNCLLATPDLQLKRAYGDVSRYITLAEGDLTMTVPSLLKTSYGQEVRMLIAACQRQNKTRFGVVRVDEDVPSRREQIRVYPVYDDPQNEQMLLIVFSEWQEEIGDQEAIEAAPESARQRIIDLERALSVTRDSLQQANEELETTNEELQALNEELQSSNEELQSTNEELETANEELQSTNEELTTVNEELHINAQEVNTLNQDLDSILSNVGIPFIVVDKELAVTRCSAAAQRYFKIEPGSMRPYVSTCRMPAGFPRIADLVVEVLESGERIERHIIGDIESANLMIAPYNNASGSLAGVVALIAFTTELTQTQKELRLLLDNVPAGVMVRNKSGEILRVNERSAQTFGLAMDKLEGSHLSDLGVPEAILREDREVIKSGKPMLNVVHEIRLKDGRSFWLRFDRVPFHNPETGETCVYSLAQDVSEALAGQQALHASEERFDLAIRGSGLGLWDWDIENGTLFWSERFKQMMGIGDKAFGGKPEDFSGRLHPDDKERVMTAIDDHLKKRVPFDIQYRLRHEDGAYRLFEARGQAHWDDDGKPRRFLGSVDDITERREQVREQQAVVDDLIRSTAAVGGPSYISPQDLKEPVHTLGIMSERLLNEETPPNDDERRELLSKIYDNASQLGAIIEKLPAVSGADNDLAVESVDLNVIVEEVKAGLDAAIKEMKATFKIGTLPTIEGARAPFRQLFQGLIGNALKYGSSKACRIAITAKERKKDWEIGVDDNGPGVAKDAREKIFEVAERTDQPKEHPDSGPSLSACREIVERYSGKIHCEASKLGGASMKMSFPKETS